MDQFPKLRTRISVWTVAPFAMASLAFSGCGGEKSGSDVAPSSSGLTPEACASGQPCPPPAAGDPASTTPGGPSIVDDGFVGEDDMVSPSPSGTTNGEVDADSACADSNTYLGRSTPAALELLVDTSCSMAQAPGSMGMQGQMGSGEVVAGPSECPEEPEEIEPFSCGLGTQDGSKWEITRDALLDAIAQFSEQTWLGMMFYPYPPGTSADAMFAGNQCECHPDVDFFIAQDTVPAAALDTTQAGLVSTALDQAVVNGSTPTHAAYQRAVEYLRAAAFTGDKYVVLITDGQPTYGLTAEGTCFGGGIDRVDSTALIAEVTAARASGIYTFVIGSPGSEGARVDLSRMAEEGGTARPDCSSAEDSALYCHLDMTTEEDFAAALSMALGQVVEQTEDPCQYALPTPPDGQMIDRGRVNVSYTDEAGTTVEVLRDPSESECNSGWQYSADQNTILLCPDTCGALMATGNTDVDILVGCRATAIGTGAR
jgi:hypothetical protein